MVSKLAFSDIETYELNNLKNKDRGELDHADSFFMLSNIYCFRKKYEKAKEYMLESISRKNYYADSWNNLGTIHTFQFNLKEAEKCFLKAIELEPSKNLAYINLLIHTERSNNLDELNDYLNKWENMFIIENHWHLFKSRLFYRQNKYLEAKKQLKKVKNTYLEIAPNQFKLLYFTFKGFIEEQLKETENSILSFLHASKYKSYQLENPSSYLNRIDILKENIIINNVKQTLPVTPFPKSKKLVFIVGFPRSGTTLLSAILAAHPQIKLKSEQNLIGQLEDVIDLDFKIKLNNLKQLSQEQIKQLREKYFSLIDNSSDIFIDKVPLNLISLPLIKLLFPSAKIIFCLRHPCGSILSVWKQAFSPSDATANFKTLESSQFIYNKLMTAWCDYKACLDLDFHEIKYEDLVFTNARQILKILKFIGLNFHPDLIKYRELIEQRHDIATPNSYQVKLPIYTTAVNQWKKYESYLDMNCLAKWIKHFNY